MPLIKEKLKDKKKLQPAHIGLFIQKQYTHCYTVLQWRASPKKPLCPIRYSKLCLMGHFATACPHVLSPHSSFHSTQFSVLSPFSSVLSTQFSVVSPQSLVLVPHSSVVSPHSSFLGP